ncbi:MAG: DNA helicase UvrD, partial [Oscillibacter sp.]|nr:DNA helicase UvrD [Oscillibacter sp.]
ADNIVYIESPQTPVFFLTVHKEKGLKADNVILLNFQNSTLGFPNQISDDLILQLVLTAPEEYPYAEECRLLYVALTRTKNRIFILLDENKPGLLGLYSYYVRWIILVFSWKKKKPCNHCGYKVFLWWR